MPLQKRSKHGVQHGVLGIPWEAGKMAPGGGGSPTTWGANQGTDRGHSEGNTPALFENPGLLRKKNQREDWVDTRHNMQLQ